MKKNKFDLSNYELTTCDIGQLVPVNCFEVLPNDTFKVSSMLFARMQPMLAPIMHPLKVIFQHWYMPSRLLWQPVPVRRRRHRDHPYRNRSSFEGMAAHLRVRSRVAKGRSGYDSVYDRYRFESVRLLPELHGCVQRGQRRAHWQLLDQGFARGAQSQVRECGISRRGNVLSAGFVPALRKSQLR